MSNLPPKPEFARAPKVWPEPGEDRRSGGRLTPDRHSHLRDDRDPRDRERGHRGRYPPRSPPRSMDTYIAGSRDTYQVRDYRGYEDTRPRDDHRRDWDREREWERERGYDRRQPGRSDDAWVARKDYGADRGSASRRGYDGPHPQESDWRSRDDYRRDRDWGRGRERDYSYEERRDRGLDRPHATPSYRGAPPSPRRDYYPRPRSPTQQPQSSYAPRGRRSSSPRSIGSRTRRSSPRARVKAEVAEHRSPWQERKSPSSPRKSGRYSHSASPRRRSPSMASPAQPHLKLESPVVEASEHRDPEEPSSHMDDGLDVTSPEPAKVEDQDEPASNSAIPSTSPIKHEPSEEPPLTGHSKGKDRSDDRDEEENVKMRSPSPQQVPRSPLERKQPPHPQHGAEATSSAPTEPPKPAVIQPYLPVIPKHEPKPKFSAAYEVEFARLEAHRAHAAAECRRSSKASRRALHELDMATLDLRAAQQRRELAESHRKKAHHGQLGIDAETA
ncbi:hypothetical protein HYDPIDRAFT_116946 [Hydnomerulius pinastri MD-312]|uniref:Uncharacterized protein n=1 Tax=Hydnomerulius pinastri MD-312 TaxID=994086 RepID=A0A0C9WBB0_9AGAM|nr:hypothetical protein HYDPIDRAFT_116946 [Hydnomerulius pinastri MD-312]